MSWKDILKMTFEEASNKANKIMMEKYNPEGIAGVAIDWATIPKYREEYGKLVQSFMQEKSHIVKESRLEKLEAIIKKYYDDEYVEWYLAGLDESNIDKFIKNEIKELKAELASVPEDGKFSDGEDASEMINASNSLIRELEKI